VKRFGFLQFLDRNNPKKGPGEDFGKLITILRSLGKPSWDHGTFELPQFPWSFSIENIRSGGFNH
jgi:hypothetical protein